MEYGNETLNKLSYLMRSLFMMSARSELHRKSTCQSHLVCNQNFKGENYNDSGADLYEDGDSNGQFLVHQRHCVRNGERQRLKTSK